MTSPPAVRRARGEVQELIVRCLERAEPGARFTPYVLAQTVGVTAGSATAAVKRLIQQDRIKCYGTSPLIVGKVDA